ncbi:MAG: hypothetical protein NZ570_00265 [Candidatus Caldarchaeum sp.]|nr:hypothetical protein [Candidatus Caldarchaeum sp.]MDW8359677.1 hypothetical protein [Candidatus Caldarchaeum sp.]
MEPLHFILGAVAYVLTGFLKSRQPFDPAKAAKTLALAALLAAANHLLGLDVPEEELAALLAAGEVAVAENLLKAVWRRVFSPI